MKKFISILLTVAIMCSFTTFAFATSSAIKADTTYTYTVKTDKSIDLTFTPSEAGIYKIELAFKNPTAVNLAAIGATICSDDYEISWLWVEKYSEDYKDLYDFEELDLLSDSDEIVCEKGEAIDISIALSDFEDFEEDKSVDVTLKISKLDATAFKIGNTYTMKTDTGIYIAKPAKDTVYNITSSSTAGMTIEIYDCNGYVNGTFFCEDEDVNYTFKLTAGKYYEIKIISDSENLPLTFKVADGSKILPEEIISYDVLVTVDDTNYISYMVLPYGSEINSKGFDVSVKDESIAKLEYDEEEDSYYVVGLKKGTTTLTITEKETGLSQTSEIEVISESDYSFLDAVMSTVSLISNLFTILKSIIISIYEFFTK